MNKNKFLMMVASFFVLTVLATQLSTDTKIDLIIVIVLDAVATISYKRKGQKYEIFMLALNGTYFISTITTYVTGAYQTVFDLMGFVYLMTIASFIIQK